MRLVLLAALICSLGVNIWLGLATARLENIHYGVKVGLCVDELNAADGVTPLPDNVFARISYLDCLERQRTRTSDWWHLYYALGDVYSLKDPTVINP